MAESTHEIDSVFLAALEKTTPKDLAAYLAQACGDDQVGSSFVESEPSVLEETEYDPIEERPGWAI